MLMPEENIFSVSELTKKVKAHFESNFADVAVIGEISNFHRHTSGHLYFTLKDAGAQLSAVMFRGNAMRMFFSPQDGMEVVCRGSLTVYEARGNYQILVKEIVPRGEGALQVAFARLKAKLAAEGLFDVERKKPLPTFPERIALVTSPTGAAIRDMLSVIERRFPCVELFIEAVSVQGAGAAEEIAGAIDRLNRFGSLDLIIVGRGGGSIEDLWAFNEEVVARSIARSRIPIVSAVGHEIDFTIADFVADLRAPTPSVAAELATPDRRELLETLRNFSYTSFEVLGKKIESRIQILHHQTQRRAFHVTNDLLNRFAQRLDDFQISAWQTMRHRIALLDERVSFYSRQIEAFNPRQLFKRGFAIVRKNGQAVTSIADVRPNDTVETILVDGRFTSTILGTKQSNDEEES